MNLVNHKMFNCVGVQKPLVEYALVELFCSIVAVQYILVQATWKVDFTQSCQNLAQLLSETQKMRVLEGYKRQAKSSGYLASEPKDDHSLS